MSTVYNFWVPGVPVPKPRMTQRDKRSKSKIPRTCVAQYWAWVEAVQTAARLEIPDGAPLLEGPIRLTCIFMFTPPRSWSRNKKMLAIADGRHTQAPDLKNLVAAVEDAMNDYVYLDDKQICQYGAKTAKRWVRKQCGALVAVEELGVKIS